MKELLLEKISGKEINVCIVGLGYVGLPLAVTCARAGFRTKGFDVQASKVEKVNNGENYISDVEDSELAALVKAGTLSATSDFGFVRSADFIAICVPTPLDSHQEPDLSYVRGSAEEVGKNLSRNTMVVLESTTYPGTTEELIKPIIEKESGLKCGVDFYLGFSPERVDPGNAVYKTTNTPKVVGAIGEDAKEAITAMYRAILQCNVYPVSTPAIAEMTKILENTYRNVNIGLMNELAILCNKMHINFWEVIEAAKTKPFGYQAFYPGPGLGGHCIPLDPYYLTWKAREYGFHTSMIEASMMINDRMPEYTAERCEEELNKRHKAINGAKVLVLGVAYKNDIDDYRESPAIRVIEELKKTGAEVKYYDPYIPEYRYKGAVRKGEKDLTKEMLKEADLVVITAAHKCFNYNFIQENAQAIFDTRNAMKDVRERGNIEVL
ncbi:MAG: nucleotide sugar dehydrogenase [Alistipes putredinis]